LQIAYDPLVFLEKAVLQRTMAETQKPVSDQPKAASAVSSAAVTDESSAASKDESSAAVSDESKEDPAVAPRVILKFLLHSLAMFTLPFAAFFVARKVALDDFHTTDMAAYVWATVAAVLAVNGVICSYIYQALKEEAGKIRPKKD